MKNNIKIITVLFLSYLIFTPSYSYFFTSEGERDFRLYCAGCHSIQSKNLFESEQWNIERPSKIQAEKWFGRQPPDLTEVADTRGVEWIKAYLLGFYPDSKSKTGSNNKVFEGTLMPNVMGERFKKYTVAQKEQVASDIAEFLVHVADSSHYKRQIMAIVILPIMFILWPLVYLLYRTVRQDYKKNST